MTNTDDKENGLSGFTIVTVLATVAAGTIWGTWAALGTFIVGATMFGFSKGDHLPK